VSYATSDSGVAALTGSDLSFVGAGSATITASQAGNADYNAATAVDRTQTVTAAALSNQLINFTLSSPVTYGASPITLNATATSGLFPTYTSSDPTIASVSGSTLTVLKAGSVTITASQAGDSFYNPAPDVPQTLVINPKALTITGATASDKVYNGTTAATITGATLDGVIGSDNVALSAAAATFASADVATGIAVTTNYTLVNSTASNYTVSQPSGLTASITQASQSISFPALANRTTADTTPFSSGATSATSAVNALAYASSNTNVATINATTGIITIAGVGTTTITVSQPGNINYTVATNQTQLLTVTLAPVTIAAWDFFGQSSPATFAATTFVTDLVSASNASNITRGAGAASSSGSNSFRTVGFQNNGISTENTDFFQITIQATAGKAVSLSTIDGNVIGTSTFTASPGVSSQFAYSLDGTTFTLIGSPVTTVGNTALPQINLSAVTALQNVPSGTTIILRYYASGQTNTGGFGFSSPTSGTNGLAIGGTIATITSTTWNGSAWSSNAPTPSVDAIIAGNLTTTVSLTSKNLTVNSNNSLTVATGTSVTVAGALANNGTITVQNNANLIQTAVTDTNTGSGSVTVNRDSNSLKRLDYTLWSTPIATGNRTLASFSSFTTPSRYYTYNSGTNVYNSVGNTGSFNPGTGYLIRMPDLLPSNPVNSNTYYAGTANLVFNGVFTGTAVNNGPMTISTTTSTYNAIGNPYPSTISANSFLGANSTDGILYFWRKSNGVGTAYASYSVALGGVANGGFTPNGTIAVAQGFIVRANSTSLVFNNTMRTGTTAQFMKTRAQAEKSRIWLNLNNADGMVNQTLVGYLDAATKGVDQGIDGKSFGDGAIELASRIDGESYTIQGRPAFDATDVVALNFKTSIAGTYSIAIDHVDGLFSKGQDIYLVDKKVGVTTNLNEGAYNFTAEAGVDNARFELTYQKTLKVDAPLFNENSVLVSRSNGTVNVKSSAVAINNVKVFDVQGRLVAERKNVKSNTATFSNLKANQVLIVKVTAENNAVVTKKVLN
jgi:hypothetical protein